MSKKSHGRIDVDEEAGLDVEEVGRLADEEMSTSTDQIVPVQDLKAKIAELNGKLPMQFAVKCSNCTRTPKVRKDVFVARVEKVQGDVAYLMRHYLCRHCRKELNKNLIGQAKISGGSSKILTLEDLI